MRRVRKRLGSILLTVAMILYFLPVTALAIDDVPYLGKDGSSQTCVSATEVTSEMTEWTASDGQEAWYVVNGVRWKFPAASRSLATCT